MSAPLDSLADYIATDLHLGTVGTSVVKEFTPDQPDTCITVYDTGGRPPSLTQDDNTDYPSFQIRSRSLDPAAALASLQTIFQALHGLTMTTVHGTLFKLVEFAQSNPVPLGRDEKQRYDFVLNLRCMVAGVSR